MTTPYISRKRWHSAEY